MYNKIICVKCEVEFKKTESGVLLIEMMTHGPYKVWSADLFECKLCKAEVVSGLGYRPLRSDYYNLGFTEWLEDQKKKAKRVIYDHEVTGRGVQR